MSQDPVSIDELRHDIDNAKRLAEQDRLEAEFRRDPDWDLVAEYLIKRETIADVLEAAWFQRPYLEIIQLAIAQCAREYAEREAGK